MTVEIDGNKCIKTVKSISHSILRQQVTIVVLQFDSNILDCWVVYYFCYHLNHLWLGQDDQQHSSRFWTSTVAWQLSWSRIKWWCCLGTCALIIFQAYLASKWSNMSLHFLHAGIISNLCWFYADKESFSKWGHQLRDEPLSTPRSMKHKQNNDNKSTESQPN